MREIESPADMEQFGRSLGEELRAGDLVVLTGPLGAGKTTLTRGIAAGLGVRGRVQSPTFVIARTHPSLAGGPALIHVDAYRLGSAAELDDLDLDLDTAVTIVEWGRGWSTISATAGGRSSSRASGAAPASTPPAAAPAPAAQELDADAPRT